MNSISVKYKLTLPEFMSACSAHWKAHKQGTRSNVVAGILGMLFGIFLLTVIFWLAVLLLIVGILLLLITGVRHLTWRRAYHETPKYAHDIAVTFSEDGIHVESAEGKSDLNWGFFSKYYETPDFALLYVTKRNFSVIPKSAFVGEQSLCGFMDLLSRKLEKLR